jgi:geranylgeranyl pyrophosphate synthase
MHKLFNSIDPDIIERIAESKLTINSLNCEKAINDLLSKTVLMGGKRLRPLLTYLMGDLFSVDRQEMDDLAWSIEYVHAASLAHDDVVDRATTRRGFPSINEVAGNKNAVLAGDYLLASVIMKLTKLGNLAVVREMAQVISELAVGEWIQSDAALNRSYEAETTTEIALKKTASVMSFCCVAPALWAKYPQNIVAYSRDFGIHLGLAFQFIDDVLDFSENSKKDFNLDMKNGLINSVLYAWFSYNPDLWERFKKGEEVSDLFNTNHLDLAIKEIEAKANHHLDQATDLLDILAREIHGVKEAQMKPLRLIVDYLRDRRN